METFISKNKKVLERTDEFLITQKLPLVFINGLRNYFLDFKRFGDTKTLRRFVL